jgi:hypothetical protein
MQDVKSETGRGYKEVYKNSFFFFLPYFSINLKQLKRNLLIKKKIDKVVDKLTG